MMKMEAVFLDIRDLSWVQKLDVAGESSVHMKME